MSACRSCHAPILWVGTERGKAMPLDAEPYDGDEPSGLFVIRTVARELLGVDEDNGDRQMVIGVAVPPDAFPDEPVYRSHFATCPHASSWRRPR